MRRVLHSADARAFKPVARAGTLGLFASNHDDADGYFLSNLSLWSFRQASRG